MSDKKKQENIIAGAAIGMLFGGLVGGAKGAIGGMIVGGLIVASSEYPEETNKLIETLKKNDATQRNI